MDDDPTDTSDPADPPRRRRARSSPFPVRVPDKLRPVLAAKAEQAGMTLGGYFLAAAQGADAPAPRRTRQPVADGAALGRLVAHVGKIGSNVNQLAHVANSGSWPDRHALALAMADIRWMRDTLMEALGIAPPAGNDNPAHVPPSLQR